MNRIYAVVLEPEPTGGFVVTAPAIPEAISQGETVAEAVANIREAVEGCLHVRRELGEEIPPSDAEARLEFTVRTRSSLGSSSGFSVVRT